MERKPTERLISTVAMRYFQEVVRAGSFRKAAERINVAASAINRHVRLLEEDLGTRLFERGRGRGGIKLTAAGEVLSRRVQYAMNELTTARQEINALRGIRRGRISIGVTDALAKEILPTLMAEFHAANPRIDFDAKVNNTPILVDLLLEDRVDLVIAYDMPPQINVTFLAEYSLPTYVVVHKDHELAGKGAVRLAECGGYPLALPDETPYLRAILGRMAEMGGTQPSPLLRTNSYQLMRDFVGKGLAISLQTRAFPTGAGSEDALVYIPIKEPLARFSLLGICVRTGRRLPVASELFISHVRDRMQAYLDEGKEQTVK